MSYADESLELERYYKQREQAKLEEAKFVKSQLEIDCCWNCKRWYHGQQYMHCGIDVPGTYPLSVCKHFVRRDKEWGYAVDEPRVGSE